VLLISETVCSRKEVLADGSGMANRTKRGKNGGRRKIAVGVEELRDDWSNRREGTGVAAGANRGGP
jgi:hypothetical protein